MDTHTEANSSEKLISDIFLETGSGMKSNFSIPRLSTKMILTPFHLTA